MAMYHNIYIYISPHKHLIFFIKIQVNLQDITNLSS